MLKLYTIFDKPADYPNHYVVRLFLNDTPTPTFYLAESLEKARAFIPIGLFCMSRADNDPLSVVETWF